MYVQWMIKIKYDSPFLLHRNFEKQYESVYSKDENAILNLNVLEDFLIRNDLGMMKDWRNQVVLNLTSIEIE